VTNFTTIVIGRTHLKPRLEIYLDGEIIGLIDVEPRGSHQTRLRISSAPALRFVRAEIDRERKDRIIFPERPKG
jgi:hypothetical protein